MRRSLGILGIVLWFISCEYKADEDFYRELEPPVPEAMFDVQLNQIHPADTIYLFGYSRLTLHLNIDGKSLYNLKIAIDGLILQYYESYPIHFDINPLDFSNGNHKLSVSITTSSNSGSIADLMGMEGYQGEIIWNVYTMNDFENRFNINYRKTEDDMLEFFWEIPRIPHTLFEKYEIQAGSKRLLIIDQHQKSFIAEDYVCGDIQFYITVFLKTYEWYSMNYTKHIDFSSPVPKLYFEDIDDKLLVYWNKTFSKARFMLSEGYTNEGIQTTDTFLIAPQTPFSEWVDYYLFIYPEKSEEIYSNNFVSGRHSITSSISHALCVTYHTPLERILAISHDQIWTIHPTTFTETLQTKTPFSGYPRILSIPGSPKIAINQYYELWIYPDHNFTNPLVIPHELGWGWPWHPVFFQLTNNDRVFWIDGYYNPNDVCDIYDVINGKKLFSFKIRSPITYPNWTVSADGKYFCEATTNGMTIHQIGETSIEQTVHVSGYYTDALFHPLNPDQLIVKERENIQIFESTDFTKPALSFVIPSTASLLNIDPATGHLLYLQRYATQDTLRVARPELVDKPLFSMATAYTDVVLLGNCLIHTYGAHTPYNAQIFNIAPYLKP